MILFIKKQLSSMITQNYLGECMVESILFVNSNHSFINIVKDHIEKIFMSK